MDESMEFFGSKGSFLFHAHYQSKICFEVARFQKINPEKVTKDPGITTPNGTSFSTLEELLYDWKSKEINLLVL
jgi:hypothetical protein